MITPKRRDGRARGRSIPRRSIVVAGRKTSFTLEDPFWSALKEIAASKRITVSELVFTLKQGRHGNNLSSAIPLLVLEYYRGQAAARAADDAWQYACVRRTWVGRLLRQSCLSVQQEVAIKEPTPD